MDAKSLKLRNHNSNNNKLLYKSDVIIENARTIRK